MLAAAASNLHVASGPVASGTTGAGLSVNGATVLAGTVITRLGSGTNSTGTFIITPAQTVSSETMYLKAVATLDTPRRVLITTVSDESAKTFTITGTGWGGNPISETMVGPAATTGYTVQDYLTVTSISVSAATTGAVTVGTNGIASSAWVRLDEWALAPTVIQATATGTVNFTLQQCNQDPNSPTSPTAPGLTTWVNSTDASAVGATGSIQSSYTNSPLWARVLLNSGTGSVSAVYAQYGNAPY